MRPDLVIPKLDADALDIKGWVSVVLRGEDGAVKERREGPNLVTTVGRTMVIERLDSTPTSVQPGWMAVGNQVGPAAETAGDTLLQAEFAATGRKALTSSVAAVGVLTMIGNWPAGDATATLTEAGIFGVVTANTAPMYARKTFTGIPKGASDTLAITWTWTLTAS